MTHVRQPPPYHGVFAVTAVLALFVGHVVAGSVSASDTLRGSSAAG